MPLRRVLVLAAAASMVAAALTATAAPAGAAAPGPVSATSIALAPPDADATDFAASFTLDEDRALASANLADLPVVYVFDRSGDVWSHSATIAAPANATSDWGRYLAVQGDTIAVADPSDLIDTENYGRVDVYDLDDGTWTRTQELRAEGEFLTFATGVWLSGSSLLVTDGGYCDGSCYYGRWHMYDRAPGGDFTHVFDSFRPRTGRVSVGVDAGRFIVGNPGFQNDFDALDSFPNVLTLWDTTASPPESILQDVPVGDDWEHPDHLSLFRKVDIVGDVIATESCCVTHQELTISRAGTDGYEAEAVLPIEGASAGLAVVPGVVLRADRAAGAWHAYVEHDGTWAPAPDLPAPDAVAASFAKDPVAAGSRVAVGGDGVLWILTIEPGPTSTYQARFRQVHCTALAQIAGDGDASDVVRLGVRILAALADAGPVPTSPPPANDGPCLVEVTWDAGDQAMLDDAAAAWGVDQDQLQHLGGRVVLAIIWALVAPDGA